MKTVNVTARIITICVAGIVTFADGSNGMPRNEGYFEGDALQRQEKCPSAVMKGRQAADRAKVV